MLHFLGICTRGETARGRHPLVVAIDIDAEVLGCRWRGNHHTFAASAIATNCVKLIDVDIDTHLVLEQFNLGRFAHSFLALGTGVVAACRRVVQVLVCLHLQWFCSFGGLFAITNAPFPSFALLGPRFGTILVSAGSSCCVFCGTLWSQPLVYHGVIFICAVSSSLPVLLLQKGDSFLLVA